MTVLSATRERERERERGRERERERERDCAGCISEANILVNHHFL